MSGLSRDECAQLRESARAALSRTDNLAAARAALDGEALPDSWPLAVEAGWPGLLASEVIGGAGLGATEAMLVMGELGRALSAMPLLGHLTATELLRSTFDQSLAAELATGARRAVWLPLRPSIGSDGSTADRAAGAGRIAGPLIDRYGRVTGETGWVPDAPGADVLVVAAVDPAGRRRAVLIEPASAGVEIEPVRGYDATRRLGHIQLRQAPGALVEVSDGAFERTWALAQALLGAESLGVAERLLEISVEHARRRLAFGRPIGSFQAIKHQLVEVLRRVENARALVGYAGWAFEDSADEAATAAGALRFAAGDALDLASRTAISVHGGMGATWEHPAALYFRRAQLSRRLIGGQGGAATDVGRRLMAAAAD